MNLNPRQPEQNTAGDYPEQTAGDQAFASFGSTEGLFLQRVVRLAKRYVWLVLICCLLGWGFGMYKNATSPKLYRSTASIEITAETADQFRLDTGGGDDGGYIDASRLDTEIAVLKSSTLAMQTIQSLHLDQNKDFLPCGSNYHWDLSKLPDRHGLIGMFEGGLEAVRYEHTNILQLSFTARNPALAATICNTLIDNYVQHHFSENYAATQEVSVWLQSQLGELKNRLEASQEHMLDVQKDIGLVGIDQTQSIVLSRLVDLNHNLTEAEGARMVAEAKLLTLQSAPPAVLPTLANDPILLTQAQRLGDLQTQYASLDHKIWSEKSSLGRDSLGDGQITAGHEAATGERSQPGPARSERRQGG